MSESSGRVVVRTLASHQCGLGSISRFGVTCGLSLLVLFSALRGFAPGTPVFHSPQKPTFPEPSGSGLVGCCTFTARGPGSILGDLNVCFDFSLIHVAIASNTHKMEH